MHANEFDVHESGYKRNEQEPGSYTFADVWWNKKRKSVQAIKPTKKSLKKYP